MKKYFVLISLIICSDIVSGQDLTSIISKTERKYENIETYLDSGKLVSSIYNISHPNSNAKIFKTAYSNTGLFNFEYYELGQSNSLYVINRGSKNKVQSWWGVSDKIKTYPNIASPLSAAMGVSSLTSTIIPKLLFNDKISGKNIFQLVSDPKLAAMESVNGNPCYKLVGQYKRAGTIEIWIAKKDFLIRKILTDEKVTNFRVKSTYQFYPYNLKIINKELFAFKPNRQIEL